MENQSMKRKIESGECLDISACQRNAHGHYMLEHFVPGVDYCDAKAEAWIWSIGRHNHTGQILASTSSELYQNPDFECLFLR